MKVSLPEGYFSNILWISYRNVELFDSTSSRPCFNTSLPTEHKHVIVITFSTVNEMLEKFGLRLKDFPTWRSTVPTMAKATHGNIWQLHTDAFRKADEQKYRNHFVMFWEMLMMKRWYFILANAKISQKSNTTKNLQRASTLKYGTFTLNKHITKYILHNSDF